MRTVCYTGPLKLGLMTQPKVDDGWEGSDSPRLTLKNRSFSPIDRRDGFHPSILVPKDLSNEVGCWELAGP